MVISNEKNAQTQINMEDVVCDRVPTFARYQESGQHGARVPRRVYRGESIFVRPELRRRRRDARDQAGVRRGAARGPAGACRSPTCPICRARDTWVNIRSLGAKGDGTTDDTEVFRKAIADHRAIYLPVRATTSSPTR